MTLSRLFSRPADLFPALLIVVGLLLVAAPAFSAEVVDPLLGTAIADADADEVADALGATAQQPKGSTNKTSTAIESVVAHPSPAIGYRPPRRGAPRARVGGGLRGSVAQPTLVALAPEEIAGTGSATPSLFWYIDALPAQDTELVFTLSEEDSIEPLVEARIERPLRAGVHRIRLDELGVRLEAGTEYEWAVSLVVDPSRRSQDVIARGYIQRVGPATALPAGDTSDLWYDALASVTDALHANPADTGLRHACDALLRQAGLDDSLQ